MNRIILKSRSSKGINDSELLVALKESIKDKVKNVKKVLLIPPDITRANSGAGKITGIYYDLFKAENCKIDVMPALGTHEPMTKAERYEIFGERIPDSCFVVHNWRKDVVKIGNVPASFVNKVSDGIVNESIDVDINKIVVNRSYDLIISIGQVVPHEVVGMANYNKNILVGCGGSSMINNTHMLGAFYGMEKIMGRDKTPVRKVLDYAENNFLKDVPLMYVLTVTTADSKGTYIHGLFAGRDRKLFEDAVALSQEKNLTFVDKPFKKVVVFLDKKEFKSTWLGNKAVYRTRMAIEDGGELVVIAPGVRKFGEDDINDVLIRKYGYVGRHKVLKLVRDNNDLKNNLSVAAHLIHGSSDGRFTITYAVEYLSREEIEGVNFIYMPMGQAIEKYNPVQLKDGYNTLENGEEIYYISNPALGLWINKNRFPKNISTSR